MTRVVVTGMGALSALGDSASELHRRLCAGDSGIRHLPHLDEPALKVSRGGEVSIDRDQPDRDVAVARHSIDAALAEAEIGPGSTAFFWANGLDTFRTESGAPGHISAGACFRRLAARHGRPRRMFAVACASGTQSIGEAFAAIRAGRVDVAVAGGSSVMLTPFYLIGFSALGAVTNDECRPFDQQRSGFALADGSAALVLESADHATARGARGLAEITGFGTSQDAFDLNRPPEDGRGALRCMERAVADASIEPGGIDAVSAHGTGTYAGDLAEAAALTALLGDRVGDTPVHSVKGAIGHAMAAAGALEAVVAIETVRSGIVPPTAHLETLDPSFALDVVSGRARDIDANVVMSESFGMGGQNAAIIVRRTHA